VTTRGTPGSAGEKPGRADDKSGCASAKPGSTNDWPHLRAPGSARVKRGSADDKSGSTSNHCIAVWEKHHHLWERFWCSWKS